MRISDWSSDVCSSDLFVVAMAIIGMAPIASAKDYGQQGAVFRISEPDLLRTIEQKLRTLEASGGIERMNAELTRKTEAGVRRPRPVAGISLAVRDRRWKIGRATD